ncbi:CHAP domain-containing protein [Pseudolysinimonas sp.]|uniref:CHAP domain-containing protein n=1 Tax=Pseudolysinimonas sp. TaxID=2680009 RepID=UPI003F7D1225
MTEAPAPVYRSRREMRAAGGYLQAAPATTPAGSPETVAATTSSIPVVPAPSAATPDVAAPDFALPTVDAPASRRALRAAQASLAAAPARSPHAPRVEAAPAHPPKAARDDASKRRRRIRDRLGAAGVMLLVGGLFVPLALPAYADAGSGGVATAAVRAHGGQALGVNGDLDKTAVTRDEYSSTSAEELRAAYTVALRQKNLSAFRSSGSSGQGNDYPFVSELSRNQGGGLSPLGYYYRECVDFVAWRLSRDAGSSQGGPYRWTWSKLTPSGGNASQWKSAWINHGWATGTTPQVGAVAWFPGGNHVAYVSGILASGQIVIDEYNWGGQHEYDQRVIDPSTVEFLYAPPA